MASITRTQEERSATTRAALLAATRRLVADRAFAEIPATAIVREAGVTRGALYHHFPAGKPELFKALFIEAQEQIDGEMRGVFQGAIARGDDPIAAFLMGAAVFYEALAEPALARILVTDGPSVLGWAAWQEIDTAYGVRQATGGLRVLVDLGVLPVLPLDTLAQMINAMTSRMGVAVAVAAEPESLRAEVLDLLGRILRGLSNMNDVVGGNDE